MAQAILSRTSSPSAGRRGDRRLARLSAQLPASPKARPAGDRRSPSKRPAAVRRRPSARRARRPSAPRRPTALLSKTVLTIQHRAGEDGKLYGSVTAKEIAEAIAEARGLKVDRKKIRLDDPIREVGTYMVEVEVGGTTARIKTIVAEQK